MDSFHFLRPEWLWGFLPLLGLLLVLAKRGATAQVWESVCDAHLLPHLLVGTEGTKRRMPFILLGLGWSLAVLALAGPVWSKLPQQVFRAESALVMVLDLSRSMDAQDVAPSRLTRAKHKILDILKVRQEGQTALVVYAGESFVVSPLTDDARTMVTLVQSLETELMPLQGSRSDLALWEANELLIQVGIAGGDILLLTDSDGEYSTLDVVEKLRAQGRRISVLGIGTVDGAPIPEQGGFLKDQGGAIVIPKLDLPSLQSMAQAGGGHFATVTLDDEDINRLLPSVPSQTASTSTSPSHRTTDLWQEEGPWLLVALLALSVPAFRSGWLGMMVMLLLVPQVSQAFSWENLWLRPDQQGVRALERDAPEAAATLFQDPDWKGIANYRAGQYQEAEQAFSKVDSPEGHYNRGNALANLGRYEEALASYQTALTQQPDHLDAQHNLEIIKKLLEKQHPPTPEEGQSQQSDSSSSKQESRDEGAKGEPSESNQASESPGKQSAPRQSDSGQGNQDKSDSLTEPDPADRANESKEPQNPSDQKSASGKPQSESPKEEKAEESRFSRYPSGDEASDLEKKGDRASSLLSKQTAENQKTEQALQQWLRRIPDDPGGLLRRKFLLEHQRRGESGRQMESQGRNW